MTKQQFDDLYLGKAVHCDTEEKANKFLELAHSVGYSWPNHSSLLHENCWNWNKKATCYRVNLYGVTFADDKFYKKEGITTVKFELEKENKLKYKVGDKVRVRKDLVVGRYYGDYLFNRDMSSRIGLETTVTAVFDEFYCLKDASQGWGWTDKMLEPIEETFNVGDVVYDESGKELTIRRIYYSDGFGGVYQAHELSKTKPLQKITKEELADKGYELVD